MLVCEGVSWITPGEAIEGSPPFSYRDLYIVTLNVR